MPEGHVDDSPLPRERQVEDPGPLLEVAQRSWTAEAQLESRGPVDPPPLAPGGEVDGSEDLASPPLVSNAHLRLEVEELLEPAA
eukprot:5281263-Pyramimonas_sp.AAC.1